MKVFELSKELNIENKDLLQIISDLEIDAKSHLSVLNDEQVQMVKDTISKDRESSEEKTKITDEKPEIVKKVVPVQKTKPIWKPDLQRMICIKNISRGKLIYKSKRQIGYTVEWETKGSTNYIELGELISLKNSDRRFITEPWIRIVEDDEIEILQYANILQFYKELIGIDNVSDILKLDFEKFKKKFDKLPEGYKNSVAEQAAEMIKSGELDSLKIKNYIEEQMDIELSILTKSENKSKRKNKTIDIA